jgi:hypothetical protein
MYTWAAIEIIATMDWTNEQFWDVQQPTNTTREWRVGSFPPWLHEYALKNVVSQIMQTLEGKLVRKHENYFAPKSDNISLRCERPCLGEQTYRRRQPFCF